MEKNGEFHPEKETEASKELQKTAYEQVKVDRSHLLQTYPMNCKSIIESLKKQKDNE